MDHTNPHLGGIPRNDESTDHDLDPDEPAQSTLTGATHQQERAAESVEDAANETRSVYQDTPLTSLQKLTMIDHMSIIAGFSRDEYLQTENDDRGSIHSVAVAWWASGPLHFLLLFFLGNGFGLPASIVIPAAFLVTVLIQNFERQVIISQNQSKSESLARREELSVSAVVGQTRMKTWPATVFRMIVIAVFVTLLSIFVSPNAFKEFTNEMIRVISIEKASPIKTEIREQLDAELASISDEIRLTTNSMLSLEERESSVLKLAQGEHSARTSEISSLREIIKQLEDKKLAEIQKQRDAEDIMDCENLGSKSPFCVNIGSTGADGQGPEYWSAFHRFESAAKQADLYSGDIKSHSERLSSLLASHTKDISIKINSYNAEINSYRKHLGALRVSLSDLRNNYDFIVEERFKNHSDRESLDENNPRLIWLALGRLISEDLIFATGYFTFKVFLAVIDCFAFLMVLSLRADSYHRALALRNIEIASNSRDKAAQIHGQKASNDIDALDSAIRDARDMEMSNTNIRWANYLARLRFPWR